MQYVEEIDFRRTAYFGKNSNPLKTIINSLRKKGYMLEEIGIEEDFECSKELNCFLKNMDNIVNGYKDLDEFNYKSKFLSNYEIKTAEKFEDHDYKELLSDKYNLELEEKLLSIEINKLLKEEEELYITKETLTTLKTIQDEDNKLLNSKNNKLCNNNKSLNQQILDQFELTQNLFFHKEIIPKCKSINNHFHQIFSEMSSLVESKDYLFNSRIHSGEFNELILNLENVLDSINPELPLQNEETQDLLSISNLCYESLNVLLELLKSKIMIKFNQLIISGVNSLKESNCLSFDDLKIENSNLESLLISKSNLTFEEALKKMIEDDALKQLSNLSFAFLPENTLTEFSDKLSSSNLYRSLLLSTVIENVTVIYQAFIIKERVYTQMISDLLIETMKFYYELANSNFQNYKRQCISNLNIDKSKQSDEWSIMGYSSSKITVDARDKLLNKLYNTVYNLNSLDMKINHNNSEVIIELDVLCKLLNSNYPLIKNLSKKSFPSHEIQNILRDLNFQFNKFFDNNINNQVNEKKSKIISETKLLVKEIEEIIENVNN